MGSMFIVAGGLSRTQMVHRVTNLAYKVSGGSFQKGMILYCLVTLAIAQVAPSAILIFPSAIRWLRISAVRIIRVRPRRCSPSY